MKRYLQNVSKGSQKTRKSGFTLIELIMVMVIIGILSVAIMPKMFSAQQSSIELGAKIVRDDLRYAADYAINTGNPVKIEFVSNGYTLKRRLEDGTWPLLTRPGETTGYQVIFGTGSYKNLILSKADINGGASIIFNSNGICLDQNQNLIAKGSNCSITLNGTKTIEIEPISSLVRLRQ